MGSEAFGAHCDHLGHCYTGQLVGCLFQHLTDLPQDVPR